MKTLGICVGATTLSAVVVSQAADGTRDITPVHVEPHNGNPRQAFRDLLEKFSPAGFDRIAVTGRKFRNSVTLTSVPEPEAVETALLHLNGAGERLDALISAGGETFIVYVIGEDGRIASVQTGNKCASGTGEFFLQQLRRMGLGLADAFRFAASDDPYRVSGRCSVFCKSDCTHATNKGVPKGRIAAGLCEMMAGKIVEIIKQIPRDRMMIIGGTAQNPVMVAYLRQEIRDLVVPPEAPYFEALGAALWALDHETIPFPGADRLYRRGESSFASLPALREAAVLVEFRTMERGIPRAGDRCILGLDVGSTTTKAVLLRLEDDRILASIYLRTAGNPVHASRECYASLHAQLGDLHDRIAIVGVGVTGSGRQIAGLHAMTGGIINEIIAHATAALFFDPAVDTIFEIGGQDAKYTYIKDGVPSDYAMNDACSAGTGSFLEEAAKETMGLEMEEIGAIAMEGDAPPNFNDQCAAFISSDIKNATHEGMTREDIVAGLVYSICMNYSNRVKGNRPVGNTIFMQGGVCYNEAVPVAMASLTGKRIVVPPEPGLMGAFGVALEIKKRIALGLYEEGGFSLATLKDRTVSYGKPFICGGGKEKCDRKCEIARIEIEGQTYPFGGACNRWYNLRFHIEVDAEKLNLVRRHDALIFGVPEAAEGEGMPAVGMNRSFLVNSYYPLYRTYLAALGYRLVLPDAVRQEGIDRRQAAFCYPAEIAHGFFADLLGENTFDYLLLPHVKGLAAANGPLAKTTCPILQGEPYYLTTAFADHDGFAEAKKTGRVLSPVVDFSEGYGREEGVFAALAESLGRPRNRGRAAYRDAVAAQEKAAHAMIAEGRAFLAELEKDPHRFAVVLFGRSYNAFVTEANMGIPHKFASRGIAVLPLPFLPLENETAPDSMYWATGQLIMKAAAFVKRHPQLFGCYITNFSCGPDSFLVGYFRRTMERKPFLILELDSHVADAGLETRIEAFLDIVRNYREITDKEKAPAVPARSASRQPAKFDYATPAVVDSHGTSHALTDPRVHFVFPSMGQFLLELAAAVFRSQGIHATALPPPGEEVLKLGRGNTSCKECLPLLLTTGSLLKYLQDREREDELLVYLMPTTSGPCRFGQYRTFLEQLVEHQGIPDVTFFSLNAEDGYKGFFGTDLTLKIWTAVVIGGIMNDIYPVLLANARHRPEALATFRREQERIIDAMARTPDFRAMQKVIAAVAENLGAIPVTRTLAETPTVLLTGEIYVRHDDLSRQFIVEKLAREGVAVKVATVAEWLYYTDWCFGKGVSNSVPPTFGERLSLFLKQTWMRRYEGAYRRILARSGLCRVAGEDVDHLIGSARDRIDPALTGEAILTVGAGLAEVPDPYCGIIAIGPFGCMPNRVAEAILTKEMGTLPFLAIESDGNPFPQVIAAKLDVFLMQALRLHERMRAAGTIRHG